MTAIGTDPRMVAAWVKMADHFLDTETRQDLPLTALSCVEAGLSPAQARDVWEYEVSPVVGFNLLSVAGEWAGWDPDWLVARIQRVRARWWNRAGPWRRLRCSTLLMKGQWFAIERCIEFFETVPAPSRARLALDLTLLTGHCFDFCPANLSTLQTVERQRLRQLYPNPFWHLMNSAVHPAEREAADRRVQRALQGIAS